MPFWGRTSNGNGTTSSSSLSSSSTSSSSINSGNNNNNSNPNNPPIPEDNQQQQQLPGGDNAPSLSYYSTNAVLFMTRSLLPTRRRLKLDPTNKLYFPYEPGKQVRSAIGIKNISKSNVAFKFQTTSPKSCYMRPPGAILSPGESLIATVFKFMEPPENNENPLDQKTTRVKFKIMSLKVKGDVEYVPEMFDALKDQVAVEQILRVVFLDPECPSPALDKLKRQLAEAEAEVEARKKPSEREISQEMREGLVIDEWKERRERYLARQHHEIDSA